MKLDLACVVQKLGGELHGDGSVAISGLAPLETANETELSFLSNPRYRKQLLASKAACVVVGPQAREEALARGACIVVEQPYLYFAKLTQLWKQHQATNTTDTRPRIHPSAVIDPGAFVHPLARIGALCVLEAGARVGADTVVHARVTLGENCVLGERCIVHSGAVIGADGFGFAPNGAAWEKIEQLGAVQIGNDVEIGANTCIDRGALHDTVIEDGVKLDNLIQIGHNVRIGRNTAMAGCVGVAGSTTIGERCTIGGAANILGHLTIGPNVHISAATVVSRSVLKPGTYTGFFPLDDNAAWERNAATLKQLYSLRDRIKALEKKTAP